MVTLVMMVVIVKLIALLFSHCCLQCAVGWKQLGTSSLSNSAATTIGSPIFGHHLSSALSSSSSSTASDVDGSSMSIMFRLTPVLQRYCEGFRSVVDDKLRYQQLLFLAAKATPMNDALKVEQNKVPGCLSTVFVHATIDPEGTLDTVA
jgi:hypothetical protein